MLLSFFPRFGWTQVRKLCQKPLAFWRWSQRNLQTEISKMKAKWDMLKMCEFIKFISKSCFATYKMCLSYSSTSTLRHDFLLRYFSVQGYQYHLPSFVYTPLRLKAPSPLGGNLLLPSAVGTARIGRTSQISISEIPSASFTHLEIMMIFPYPSISFPPNISISKPPCFSWFIVTW